MENRNNMQDQSPERNDGRAAATQPNGPSILLLLQSEAHDRQHESGLSPLTNFHSIEDAWRWFEEGKIVGPGGREKFIKYLLIKRELQAASEALRYAILLFILSWVELEVVEGENPHTTRIWDAANDVLRTKERLPRGPQHAGNRPEFLHPREEDVHVDFHDDASHDDSENEDEEEDEIQDLMINEHLGNHPEFFQPREEDVHVNVPLEMDREYREMEMALETACDNLTRASEAFLASDAWLLDHHFTLYRRTRQLLTAKQSMVQFLHEVYP